MIEWRAFNIEEFPEGTTALFAVELRHGWSVFVDRIVWDSETPAAWGEDSSGWEIDDVLFWAPLNFPEATTPPGADS